MHFILTQDNKSELVDLQSFPCLKENQYISSYGRQITPYSLFKLPSFSQLHIQTRVLGGSLSEDDRALAIKRFTVQVCRKCNARLSIRADHCRKRMCGFSDKLRMKKKLREVGKK